MDSEAFQALALLVEASRSVARNQREPILAFPSGMSHNLILSHPGLPQDNPGIYPADLHQLQSAGWAVVRPAGSDACFIDITPAGVRQYEQFREQAATPVQRIEAASRSWIESEAFRLRHPEAHAKWASAEQLLWRSDAGTEYSAIGHYCREAAQEFATSLLKHHPVDDAPADPGKTKARVAAVLVPRSSGSKGVDKTIIALLEYWSTILDLGQRQEHGGQKEGEALTWEDGRRLVVLTLLAMLEIDRFARAAIARSNEA
jgi:hypothetical protein